jgi:pilus assembly protein CpaB
MMRKRGLFLVMLSVVMGAGAAWFANQWVETRTAQVADAGSANVTVIAAAIDIPYGTKVESRHLKTIEMPADIVPQGVINSIADVEGYVANADIVSGEMLLTSRFNAHTVGSTLAALIGENMRAITVRVDDVVGVAGFLLPGNYVDVLATKVERKTKKATTETILQKIKVLAVDQTARTNESDPVVVRAVTLEMSLEDSEILTKRKAEGTIQLTLRNPNDEEIKVAEKTPPKRVVRRPAPKPTVEIIRGTRVAQKQTAG